MLQRYQIWKSAEFELSRCAHQEQNLGLEPVDLRASRGTNQTDASGFEHPDFQLFYFRHSLDVTLTAGAENPHYWAALPITVTSSNISLRPAPGRMASPTRNDPVFLAGQSHTLGLCLKHHALMDFAAPYLGDDGLAPIVFDPKFDISLPAFRALGQLVIMIIEEERNDPTVLTDTQRLTGFRDAVILTLLHYCPHSHTAKMRGPTSKPASRDVRRVIDFIHAQHGEEMTLETLVGVAQVPGRTLNEHFRVFTGLSPMAYLKRTRLSKARQHMRSGDAISVTNAALEAGLTHLGRFAGEYQSAFGERPSDTLSRNRRH